MTTKTKVIVALLTAALGVVLVFAAMYWFTIGYTEQNKNQMIKEAELRLTEEHPDLLLNRGELYNGTDAYIVFVEEEEQGIWFVPVDQDLEIEQREIGSTHADEVCEQSLQETGGTLVSCKYGFDQRALIEVVSKADTSYTYSYYTLQTGEFIRRVQLTDAM